MSLYLQHRLAVLCGGAPILAGLAATGVGVALARFLRYRLIEPVAITELCLVETLWWCPLRTGLIIFMQWGGIGWLAGALVVLALIGRGTGRGGIAVAAAILAMAAGGVGLVLYNATLAGLALVLGGLVLAGRPLQRQTYESNVRSGGIT